MKRLYKSEEALYYRESDLYIEFEQTVFSKYMVWYCIPKDENSYYIATCWPHIENVFSALRKENIDINIVFDTWPSMKKLIKNGIEKNYNECALVRVSDFDNKTPIWLLLSTVENQKNSDLESIFDTKSIEIIKKIQDKSALLLAEIINNEPKLRLKDIGQVLGFALTYFLDSSIKEIISDHVGEYIDVNLLRKNESEMSFTKEIVNNLLDHVTDSIFKSNEMGRSLVNIDNIVQLK